jgi:MFS family permease
MPNIKLGLAVLYFTVSVSVFRSVTFPIYASMLGISDLTIGAILASWTITAVVVYYPSALLSEWLGARNGVFLSMLFYIVSSVILTLQSDAYSFFVSYILYGISQAFLVQRNTLIAMNTSTVTETRSWYSLTNSTGLTGRIVGAASVSLLYLSHTAFGFRLGYAALTLTGLMPLPFLLSIKNTSYNKVVRFKPSAVNLLYSTAPLIVGFGQGVVLTLLQLYYSQLGFNLLGISLIYTMTGVAGFIGIQAFNRLKASVLSSYIILSVVYGLAAAAISLPVLYSVVCIGAFSFVRFARSVTGSAIRTEVLKAINQVEKGYGVGSAAGDVGDTMGTVLQGYLFDLGDYQLPFFIGGAAIIFGSFVNVAFFKRFASNRANQ